MVLDPTFLPWILCIHEIQTRDQSEIQQSKRHNYKIPKDLEADLYFALYCIFLVPGSKSILNPENLKEQETKMRNQNRQRERICDSVWFCVLHSVVWMLVSGGGRTNLWSSVCSVVVIESQSSQFTRQYHHWQSPINCFEQTNKETNKRTNKQ
jgi:hypothetical protein